VREVRGQAVSVGAGAAETSDLILARTDIAPEDWGGETVDPA
jgi:hypothetical protein